LGRCTASSLAADPLVIDTGRQQTGTAGWLPGASLRRSLLELISLTVVLDGRWGRITRVSVDPAFWPVTPRKVPVSDQTVGVGWFAAEQDAHKLILLSYGLSRRDLPVVTRQTAPSAAARRLTAASNPRHVRTGAT
jgi:Family of unknown function (DUF5994)